MIYYLDLFGVVVFAVTGSLAAGRKHLDLFGVVVLALATALGGGTLRDLILDAAPIFWVSDPVYLYAAIAAAIITFLTSGIPSTSTKALQTADAVGLAVFTVIGCQKAMDSQVPLVIVAIMGVMTGVVGGMIRDILAGEIPLILRREIYATAALIGACFYIFISYFLRKEVLAIYMTISLILVLRLAAIRWQLSLPVFTIKYNGKDSGS